MIPSDKKALHKGSPTKTDLLCKKLLKLGLCQTFLSFSCTVLAYVCLDYLRKQHVLAALSGGALFFSICLTVSGIIETAGTSRCLFRRPNTKYRLFLICVIESIVFVPGAIGFFGRICYLINMIRGQGSDVSPDIDFPIFAFAIISPVAGMLAFIVFGITMCTTAILHYHEPPAHLQVHTISYNPESCEQALILCPPDLVLDEGQEYLPADIAFDQSFSRRHAELEVPSQMQQKIG